MGINLKSIGKTITNTMDDLATKGGNRIGYGLYSSNLVSSASTAAKIGKQATYGAMIGAGLGIAGSVDEYQYGAANGVANTLSGAGLGAVGVGGAAAVATAIAKGLR